MNSLNLDSDCVVAPHHLAIRVGKRILHQGGNAYDAAVAISVTLSVVYPHMTGVGGDAFFLMYHADSDRLRGYNGTGRAASEATIEFFKKHGFQEIPKRGVHSAITVPGMVDSWWSVWSAYGRLPWQQLFEDAIHYAEKGFQISSNLALWIERDRTWIEQCPYLLELYFAGGEPKGIGDELKQPRLAQILRVLQQEGCEVFYRGSLMREIVSAVEADGGLLRAQDFEAHTGTWVEPISTMYRGYEVFQMPPNSQGFTVLSMLNMLEGIDVQKLDRNSPAFYRLMAEVVKRSFADRDQYLTDPEFAEIPLERLLDKVYAAQQMATVSRFVEDYQSPPMGQDTAYAAVVDNEGNAVSFIQSLYFDFGSLYPAGETGIILQNRGSYFSLDQHHPNVLQPGKRTFHTLCPAMVFAHKRPYLLLGTQGGEGQPQTQISLLTGVLDYGLTPQEALDLPRWIYGRTWGEENDGLRIEMRQADKLLEQIEAIGHPVTALDEWDDQAGQAMMIRIHPDGRVEGAVDRRSDGME